MLNVVASAPALSMLNNAVGSFPKLHWQRCTECSRGVVARGVDDLCSTHKGAPKPKFQLRQTHTGSCYLYERDGDQYVSHHALVAWRWLRERYAARKVDAYLHSRHVHHVDGNSLNNQIDNLLPILDVLHAGFGNAHQATAKNLWELEDIVLPWMLKNKLLRSKWRPESLPAVIANRSTKDYEGIQLPRR